MNIVYMYLLTFNIISDRTRLFSANPGLTAMTTKSFCMQLTQD